MGVEVHIEELVLHGFSSRDRHRIAYAVRLELGRLIGAAGDADFLKRPLAIERLNGGTIKITPGAKPYAAGTTIASAVFRGLRQPTAAPAGSAQPFGTEFRPSEGSWP
jgi:hypothetical protein